LRICTVGFTDLTDYTIQVRQKIVENVAGLKTDLDLNNLLYLLTGKTNVTVMCVLQSKTKRATLLDNLPADK